MIVRANRLQIKKEHVGKGVVLVFPLDGAWHAVEHDVLVEIVSMTANYLNTLSWRERGGYGIREPNDDVILALKPYRLDNNPEAV